MGSVFEEICRQYLWKLLLEEKCAISFCYLGRWWGTDPKRGTQEEIDIIGTDKDTGFSKSYMDKAAATGNVTLVAYEDMLKECTQ